jgi:hypothetical protein
MIETPKIKTLDKSFDDLFEDLREYHKQQGELEYSAERFQWFRPEDVQDIQDGRQISEPYSLEQLNQQGKEYIDDGNVNPTRKDFSILDYQMSLLQSFARAFNERHTSKLRHFSHSAGVSDIMSAEGVGVIDQIYTCAEKILSAK